MEKFNEINKKTYNANFQKYKERTVNVVDGEFKIWIDNFLKEIPIGGNVLELGSAAGRDARYFREKEYNVNCTDIISEALNDLSEEGFETEVFDFYDEPKENWLNSYDGFFANAVLLHAPQDIFEKNIKNISRILKKDGIAAFSLKIGEGEEATEEKMDALRYFNYHTEEEIINLLNKNNYKIINISKADNGKWLHVIIQNS